VGFRTHDEERVDGVNPDGSAQTATRKKLARVFAASLARDNTLFIKIMFPTTASNTDLTKTARAQLMDYIHMVQAIDETALLYRWEQKAATKADACIKPTALPTTLTGLQSFTHQFKPNADGGDCWCSIRIGFSKDPDEFMAELRAQAASRKWMAKNRPSDSIH
jgi:hypothetical protein